MTEIDALAPGVIGRWTREHVIVERAEDVSPGTLVMSRTSTGLAVRHALTPSQLAESLVDSITDQGLTQREFELVLVGLVRSTVDDPVQAWVTYYKNSLDQILSGASSFAPVHEFAESLVIGSVLDLGSCFGFFPLRLKLRGTPTTATDLSAGTMRLLQTVAPFLGVDLEVVTADASGVPVADNSADTVTALHLLEHVDAHLGEQILDEALRIARHRVVIAVPFEDEATLCHGHVRVFDSKSLTALGRRTARPFEVIEFHGGWLILDLQQGSQPGK